MKLSVVGAGYVGLVSAACFADRGHEVTCVDVDAEKVSEINGGKSPIYERGLDEILQRVAGRSLTATTDLRGAVIDSEMTFIAVGTPFDGQHIDLSYIKEAARAIGEALRDKSEYHVVVVKSTVIPGTTDGVVRTIIEEASGKTAGVDFGLSMNPEFLTEGEAVGDFMEPDRIVCAGIDARTQEAMLKVYEPFGGRRVVTNNPTAELIKYTSNALLATLISFSNEIANIATTLGNIDAAEVMQGLHSSRYLTVTLPDGREVTPPIASFLLGGCGFGGSCLPKDVSALVAQGQQLGLPMQLLRAVLDINAVQHRRMVAMLEESFPKLSGVRVAVLGLSFRPDTNDMRESPAIPIVEDLLSRGADVIGYDPAANAVADKLFGGRLALADNLEQAVGRADAILLVTRWDEFRGLPQLLAKRGEAPLVVDGRRLLEKTSVPRYAGIGLG